MELRSLTHGPHSEDLRWTIANMWKHLTINDIIKYTQVWKRTIEQILSIHKNKGCILNSPKKPRGQPAILDDGDRDVCIIWLLLACSHQFFIIWQSWFPSSMTPILMSWSSPCLISVVHLWHLTQSGELSRKLDLWWKSVFYIASAVEMLAELYWCC